ncbi:MAG: DUF4178 domain-containing protein [Pseudonocardiaceae bacterium]|nr:DUF4178 domain-containing protein [Pseudonocardiaceae bacterium]
MLAVVALVIGLIQRMPAKQRRSGAQAPPTDPFASGDSNALFGDPRTIRAGDIVEIHGAPYTVRGSLRYDEGGWTWSTHFLDDAKGSQAWLSVEEDPDLELSVWTPLPDAGLEPGPSAVEHGGRRYKLDESGTAKFRSEATTGLAEQGSVRYYDYEAADGAMLAFESYEGAEWEASTGENLNQHALRIYPMSQNG